MSWSTVDWRDAILVIEWLIVGYFLLLHGGHTLLTVAAMKAMRSHVKSGATSVLPRLAAGYEIPVSIIVPVTDSSEELGRLTHSLFNLAYTEFEVIVVLDGLDDETVSRMQRMFDLEIFPEVYWRQVRSKTVKGTYRSLKYPRLRVIDKRKGGVGDAVNAGVNAARYPIVCIAHAECGLQKNSLRQLVQNFLDHPTTVATGSAPRYASRSLISTGFLDRPRDPGNLFSFIPASANLRRDICARLGWSARNACLTFSERFCAFRKEAYVQAGGCNREASNPLLELLMRIHRMYLWNDKSCRITLSAAPIVWRPAPTQLARVCVEIADDHRGLSDALKSNSDILWRKRAGAAGWLAYPFLSVTEIAGPSIEILSLLFFITAYAFDFISGQHLVAFLVCSVGLGIVLSWLAIILDGLIYRTYRGAKTYVLLLIGAIFENIGFRQITAICALPGLRSRIAVQKVESQ